MAPRIISFINLKGGVGKTTSAIAISEFLSEEHSQRVLVVDLDPQTNATIALIPDERWKEMDEQGQTLRQLFADKLEHTNVFDINRAIIRQLSNLHRGLFQRLALLPSSLGLIELQDKLALIPAGTYYSLSPVDILQQALRPVLADFDYVIIDCPPNMGIITLNGIGMSTGFVIPVIPDILSTYGIPQILDRVGAFARAKGIEVPPKGIIVSKYRVQSGLHQSRLQWLRASASVERPAEDRLPPIFDTVIPEAAKIAESVDVSAGVNTLRQKYGTHYATYAALAREFMTRC